jgi:dihydroorotase
MNVNSLLIRHARILLAGGEWLTGDVLVRDERIVEIAANITTTEVSREIDATGLVAWSDRSASPFSGTWFRA